jgi:hypothetical protein
MQNLVFPMLTASIPILFSVFLFASMELFFRHRSPPVYAPAFSLRTFSPPLASVDRIPTHVPIHLPPPLLPAGRAMVWANPPIPLFHAINADPDAAHFIFDRDVGNMLAPSRISHARAVTPDGSLIYDVNYGIDQWSRRMVPGQSSEKKNKALLFLGCSFAFGLGLSDEEAIPAVAQSRARYFRAYNYGFPSWGPGNVLRRLSKPTLKQEIPERGGVAVYVFIDHHMARLLGNLSLERFTPNWYAFLPYYYLDSQGKLQSNGMISEARPVKNWLFRLLAKSSTLSYFQMDLPFRYGDGDYQLMAAVFEEMKSRLQKEVGIERFYVMFYPGSKMAQKLIPFLDRYGISSVDYSSVDLSQYVKVPAIPKEELHPSAESDRFVAERLVQDLQLDR